MALMLTIKVVPSSGKNEWKMEANQSLKCYLKSAPEKGMSHCMNYDSYQRAGYNLGVSPLLFSYIWTRMSLNKFSFIRDFIQSCEEETRMLWASFALINHFTGLPAGKWHEYRSDQEVIQRIDDPEILKAVRNAFQAGGIIKQYAMPIDEWMYELWDEHPHDNKRAAYFDQACQQADRKNRSIKN